MKRRKSFRVGLAICLWLGIAGSSCEKSSSGTTPSRSGGAGSADAGRGGVGSGGTTTGAGGAGSGVTTTGVDAAVGGNGGTGGTFVGSGGKDGGSGGAGTGGQALGGAAGSGSGGLRASGGSSGISTAGTGGTAVGGIGGTTDRIDAHATGGAGGATAMDGGSSTGGSGGMDAEAIDGPKQSSCSSGLRCGTGEVPVRLQIPALGRQECSCMPVPSQCAGFPDCGCAAAICTTLSPGSACVGYMPDSGQLVCTEMG